MDKFSLYIHIPFCRPGKCLYCDFYSVPAERNLIDRFLRAIGREMDTAPTEFGAGVVSTVFFGGGTPSLLEPESIGAVLEKARNVWRFGPGAEISLEANPEDVTPERLRGWLKAGVNRLSVGCQSFDDRSLRGLGRMHDVARSMRAVCEALDAGFERLSADLILGGPGSCTEAVLSSVETALSLGVSHLSIYGYHLEETCAASERPEFAECDEELYREQYLACCGLLDRAGWEHYEMSNWARGPGDVCAHNLACWHGLPYLGLGPSAHSFLPPDCRFWNARDLGRFLAAMENGTTDCRGREFLSDEQVREERVMLGLRLRSGLSRALLEENLDGSGMENLSALEAEGLVEPRGEAIRVTDRGWLVLDSLVGALLGVTAVELDKKQFDYQN